MLSSFEELKPIVLEMAAQFNLRPSLIFAVIEQESLPPFETASYRGEIGWFEKLKDRPKTPTGKAMTFTRLLELCASWGLMQVMGITLEELCAAQKVKRPRYLSELCADPRLAIEWGCRVLRYKIDRALARGFDERKGVLWYNGDPAYPGKVYTREEKYKRLLTV